MCHKFLSKGLFCWKHVNMQNQVAFHLPFHGAFKLGCKLTIRSHQKLPERQRQPAVMHFQCTLATNGILRLGCSEQCNGSELSDHRCHFGVEQSSALCKWAATTSKQQPIANQDVTVFPQPEKFPVNISSFWSSTVIEKLIIGVSGFPELYDASLFSLPWQMMPARRWQKEFGYLGSDCACSAM